MRRMYWACIAVALSTAVPAFAQTKQTGITYDCDTAADRFSELILPAPETPFTVTGRVQLNSIAVIEKYAPITRLQISSSAPGGGQSADKVAGFEITALPADALKPNQKNDGTVLQFLGWDERPNDGKKGNDLPTRLKYSGSLPFSLIYNGSSVTMKVGEQEKTMKFTDSYPVVRLICSTGEFLYTGLKIEKFREAHLVKSVVPPPSPITIERIEPEPTWTVVIVRTADVMVKPSRPSSSS